MNCVTACALHMFLLLQQGKMGLLIIERLKYCSTEFSALFAVSCEMRSVAAHACLQYLIIHEVKYPMPPSLLKKFVAYTTVSGTIWVSTTIVIPDKFACVLIHTTHFVEVPKTLYRDLQNSIIQMFVHACYSCIYLKTNVVCYNCT